MLEKTIEKKIRDYAKYRGWLSYKFSSPSHRGVPDAVFLCDGVVFFIEFKQRCKTTTLLQKITINDIEREGVLVFVVDSLELGKAVIDAQTKRLTQLSK